MIDREKIIKGLECHRIDNKHRINCADCPYYVDDDNHINCVNDLHDDALALLKEQEAKQVNISQTHCGMKYGLCPRCEKQIDTLVNPHYCGNCGQAVKWDG